MSDGSEFRLLSDEPSVEAYEDALGFADLSTKLSGSILRSRASTPFTLGIEGGWGSGKSSLMRRLQRDLETDPAVTTVWFNAWSAEGAGALEGLIKTVLDRFDPSILRRTLRNRKLISGARTVALLVASIFGFGRVVDQVWDKVAVDARSRNELRGLLHDAMEAWRNKNAGVTGQRMLVIFVDDLDRASPDQVFEIFEAMKLYLDAAGFVFIVGYDSAIISEAVLEERKYSRSVTGREYIEKIVQVAYRLASPDDLQAQALMDRYTADSGTADLFDVAARVLVVDRNARNPRRIKRFLNGFVLLFALDPDWKDLGPRWLVEVLLLDMYFEPFAALFRARADADPVTEFLAYVDKRAEIEDDSTSAAVADEAIKDIERELPDLYPLLVTDTEFVTLVRNMRDRDGWTDVRAKLQRRRRPTTTTAGPGMAPAAPSGPPAEIATDWMGSPVQAPQPTPPPPQMQQAAQPASPGVVFRPVVWIDDPAPGKPGFGVPNEVVDVLKSRGLVVVEVSDIGAARSILSRQPGSLVVSNVDRQTDSRTGFDDLRTLQEERRPSGPAALYTVRITPDRRQEAEKLGVILTGDPLELVALASEPWPPPVPPWPPPRSRPDGG